MANIWLDEEILEPTLEQWHELYDALKLTQQAIIQSGGTMWVKSTQPHSEHWGEVKGGR